VNELVVPLSLHRNAPAVSPTAAVDGAVQLIDHMCGHLGVSDLGELEVLDFGCGVRFTQAFVDRGVPIGHYVGVDAAADVIGFLRAAVDDPRLEHYHLDAHNDLYNPTGQPLSELTVPEIEGRKFDLICLFSVFTHLGPLDYSAMLRLLRRFVKTDGHLFFTLFINEETAGGYGYIDQLIAGLEASDDPRVKAALTATENPPEVPDFCDVDASAPMLGALYSRRFALELIAGTGWDIVEVAIPDVHLQHHIVCVPS
jgi:SAM-dependent methyltransferase